MIPSLEELYIQCRIDESNEMEDGFLTLCTHAAREKAERYLNRRLHDETVPDSDSTGMVITPLIRLYIMQLVNFWYDNRDQTDSVPDFFYAGINDYRLSPGT